MVTGGLETAAQVVRVVRLSGAERPLEVLYFVEGPGGERVPAESTAATLKLQCDMKEFFGGYGLTATGLHLSLEADGVEYESKVDCTDGFCAPQDMTGVINACDAICGADPCVPSDERSLEVMRVNQLDPETFIRNLQMDTN